MHRLFVASALAIAGACQAQTFWQGTSYGDTVEQVQAKVPTSSAPQRSDDLQQKGVSTLLTVPAVLADREFDANFYFSSKGLDQVILIMKNLSSDAEASAAKGVLVQALRLKYGRATKSEDLVRSVREDKPLWIMWASADTDILLVPQHHSKNLMVAYTLSDRAKERADARAAKKYMKKLDPKAEAAKL